MMGDGMASEDPAMISEAAHILSEWRRVREEIKAVRECLLFRGSDLPIEHSMQEQLASPVAAATIACETACPLSLVALESEKLDALFEPHRSGGRRLKQDGASVMVEHMRESLRYRPTERAEQQVAAELLAQQRAEQEAGVDPLTHWVDAHLVMTDAGLAVAPQRERELSELFEAALR